MLKALWSTVVEIADSKKAVMAVLAVLAAGAARLGWNFSAEGAFTLISPLLVLIAAQAHVDATATVAAAKAASSAPPIPK